MNACSFLGTTRRAGEVGDTKPSSCIFDSYRLQYFRGLSLCWARHILWQCIHVRSEPIQSAALIFDPFRIILYGNFHMQRFKKNNKTNAPQLKHVFWVEAWVCSHCVFVFHFTTTVLFFPNAFHWLPCHQSEYAFDFFLFHTKHQFTTTESNKTRGQQRFFRSKPQPLLPLCHRVLFFSPLTLAYIHKNNTYSWQCGREMYSFLKI